MSQQPTMVIAPIGADPQALAAVVEDLFRLAATQPGVTGPPSMGQVLAVIPGYLADVASQPAVRRLMTPLRK